MDIYRASMENYTHQQSVLMERFAHDLADEHAMIDHPKQEMLYRLAVELADGSDDGLHAIIGWYERLLPLAR